MKQKLIELAQYMRDTEIASFAALAKQDRHAQHREASQFCLDKYMAYWELNPTYISDEEYLDKKIEFVINLSDKISLINPRQLFLEMWNGLTIKIDLEKYPNSVFFFNGDNYFFEIEKAYLWCSYKNVWSVFESEFGLKHNQIKELISGVMEEHFKMRGVTPLIVVGSVQI